MNIYKAGAIINIIVILFLGIIFTMMHFWSGVGDFITNEIILPLNLNIDLDRLLFFNSKEIYIPIAIIGGLFLLIIVLGIVPLLKIRSLIQKNWKKIGLAYFLIVSVLSLPIGGGILMVLGLIGLRPGIYVKRDVIDRDLDQQKSKYHYDYDDEHYDTRRDSYDYGESENFIVEPKNNFDSSYKNESLEMRINKLEKENARLEEDSYFSNRRKNRRIENLEIDLASERRNRYR